MVLVHSEGGTKGMGSLEVADRKGRRDRRQMSQRERMRALGLIRYCLAAPRGWYELEEEDQRGEKGRGCQNSGSGNRSVLQTGSKCSARCQGEPKLSPSDLVSPLVPLNFLAWLSSQDCRVMARQLEWQGKKGVKLTAEMLVLEITGSLPGRQKPVVAANACHLLGAFNIFQMPSH